MGVRSGPIREARERLPDRCQTGPRLNVCVQAVYVYGEEECVGGDDHGPYAVQEVVGVFEVAGVSAGEGVEVVLDVFRHCVRFTPAVGDYGSTRRNHTGDCPSLGILVYFGENVE